MKKLWLTSLLLLGLSTGSAFASAHNRERTSAVGAMAALSTTSISVDGKNELTCRIDRHSPRVRHFQVEDRVAIACSEGVLRKLRRLPDGASATGTVRSLSRHWIGVDGERDLSCRRGDDSPSIRGVSIGDKIAIACADGVLVRVAAASAVPEVASAGGTITALGAGSITVRGERSLTCGLTGDSPISRELKVGDRVGIACVDGDVVKIVRLPQLTEPSTSGACHRIASGRAQVARLTRSRSRTSGS